MQKIEIEFKDQNVKIFLIVKEKNLDKTLLNTNIISNEKLLFSLDYIEKNQKLVSSFLKEICLEKKTNTIICNDMQVISSVGGCFKSIPINKVIMNANENFTYNAYEAISKIQALKEVECLTIPTYLLELFDKENIKVVSRQEVLFTSQFMANNDLNNYSAIFYAKNVKLMCPIVTNDYNDLITFFKINKYLKKIELYKLLIPDLVALIDLLKEMRIKNITICIHSNITEKEIIEQIKEIKKDNKKYHINITLAYSNEYIENNYIKELIATTIKSCFIIVIILCGAAFGFVFYSNKVSLENVNQINKDISEFLETKVDDDIKDNDDNIDEPSIDTPDVPSDNNGVSDGNTGDNDSKNEENTRKENPVILALKELNSDTVGWLNVPGTNIDYPIVKASDNDFYLYHNFNKKRDYNGWVFMNYVNSSILNDQNTIIFAHNRYYSHIMFGNLSKIGKKDWYSNVKNNLITYSDLYTEGKWEVFAAYTTPVTDDYLKTNFDTKEEFQEFIKTVRDRSIFASDIEIGDDDKILTLSTCASNDSRFVVHAVLKKEA